MMDHYRSTHPGQENATAEMLYKVALNAAGSDSDYYTTGRTARNPFIASLGTAMVLSTGGYDAQADHQERNNSFAQVKGALIGKDGETTLSQIEESTGRLCGILINGLRIRTHIVVLKFAVLRYSLKLRV